MATSQNSIADPHMMGELLEIWSQLKDMQKQLNQVAAILEIHLKRIKGHDEILKALAFAADDMLTQLEKINEHTGVNANTDGIDTLQDTSAGDSNSGGSPEDDAGLHST